MAGQFTTTAEEMRAFSARITEVNGQIQGEIGKLNTLIDDIASHWVGAAATAYHQLQTEWNQDAADLNKVLGEIRDAIDATTKAYAQTEDGNRQGLGGGGGA